jgi:hypothetical protein
VELTVSMYSPLGALRDMASTLAERNGWVYCSFWEAVWILSLVLAEDGRSGASVYFSSLINALSPCRLRH